MPVYLDCNATAPLEPRVREEMLRFQTVELKPSNTVLSHRDSQEAPIWANGSAKAEMPLHRVLFLTSSKGGG
jgi:cysteine sulfinate desulfinase/cysteine desulfurase-like protein